MALDVKVSPVDLLIVAAVGVGAWFAWRAIGGARELASDAAQAVGQWVDQTAAEVQQAWGNFGEPAPARTEKWWLYSDEQYTGNDPFTGLSAVDGARAYDDFRRYENEFRAGEAALGLPRSTTTTAGAAFGIYPRP